MSAGRAACCLPVRPDDDRIDRDRTTVYCDASLST